MDQSDLDSAQARPRLSRMTNSVSLAPTHMPLRGGTPSPSGLNFSLISDGGVASSDHHPERLNRSVDLSRLIPYRTARSCGRSSAAISMSSNRFSSTITIDLLDVSPADSAGEILLRSWLCRSRRTCPLDSCCSLPNMYWGLLRSPVHPEQSRNYVAQADVPFSFLS